MTADWSLNWLSLLETNSMDFTNSFRALGSIVRPKGAAKFRENFTDIAAFDAWHASWLARLQADGLGSTKTMAALNAANPKYIPRNHRIEQAIRAAEDEGDFSLFHALVEVLKKPFAEQPRFGKYAAPPAESEEVLRTFCGT